MKSNFKTALIVAGVLSAFYTPNASAANVGSYSELSSAIQNGTTSINVTTNIAAEGDLGSVNSGSTSITMGSNSLSGTNNGTSHGGISVGNGADLSISGVMKDFTAPNGGAASVNNGTLTIGSNSTFTNNTATNWYGGGAIYGRDSEITINDNVTFDGNKTTELSGLGGGGNAGGAIASWGTDLSIGNGADFKNNGSGTYSGGAIYSDGTTKNPDGTFSDVGSLTVGNDADFTGNSSSAHGGAIFNGDAKAEIGTGANFSGNTSGSGGAIYNFDAGYPKVEGNDVGMKIGEGATFEGNTATTGNGGAITNNYSDIEIGKDSSFTNNTAAGNGGAINNISYKDATDDLPGTVTINGGANFSDNKAAGNGGAIYNGGTLNLDTAVGDITFSNNIANGSANDLFQKDGGVTNITGDANKISFGSGIAGSGEINKTGGNTLELAGDNSGFTGDFTQSAGETVVTSTGSMFAGENNIEGGNIKLEDEAANKESTINLTSNGSNTTHGSMEISIGDGKTVDLGTTITAESSQNVVNKTGTGDLTITNKDYSGFEGTFNSKEGTTEFKGDDAKLFQTTNVESGSELKLTDGAKAVKGDLTIASGGTVTLSGAGSAILAAVDADISGDMNINTGATVDLNTGDTWGGDITLGGGSLTVNDITNGGDLKADSGNLNLGATGSLSIGNDSYIKDAVNANLAGDVNITGTGDVTLNTGDSWGGDITLGGGSLTVNDITNGGDLKADSGNLNLGATGNLNIGNDSYIKGDVNANLAGDVNITGTGDVKLNTGDSWTGDIALGGGSLTVSDITNTGGLKADSGNLTIEDSATLNIGNDSYIKDAVNANLAGDVNISGNGNVSLNQGDSWTGNITMNGGELSYADLLTSGTLIANDGTLKIESGILNIGNGSVIAGAVDTTIKGDVNITGTGDVTLNTGDSWTGDITLGGGSLTVSDITNTGDLKADSGNLTVNDSATLNIGGDSYIKNDVTANLAGNTNISGTGEVNLNTGDSWTGDIKMDGGTLNYSDLTSNGQLVANSGTLNINSGTLTIGQGSIIKDVVDTTITGDLNITGNGNVSLNQGDTWTGDISLGGGSLTVSDITNAGGLKADNGNLNLGATGNLNIGNDSYIKDAVNANLAGDVNITGTGDVSLNTGDSWTGDITLGGGSLTVSDITNAGGLKADSGNLTVNDSATLNVGQDSYIKNDVTANLAGDVNITDNGDVNLNTGDTWGGDITLGGGSLTVNDITNDGDLKANSGNLTLGSTGTLNIGENSVIKDAVIADVSGTLNISNGGDVTLNLGDTVNGTINLKENGNLTVDNIALDFTGNKFTQDKGALNINNNGSVKIDNGLADGTVAIGKDSTLEIANTSDINITSTISNSSATAKILQSGSGTTNYTNDLSAFTGLYHQTDGTSTYTNKFFGGNSILDKGAINFKDGSSMTSDSTLAMGDNTNVNINVGDGHNQNYNNFSNMAGGTGAGSQIVKDGTGTMTLSGNNSNYTGTFTQMEGVTEVAENTKLFGEGSHTIIENGSMNLNNGVETSDGSHLNINTGAQLNVNNTNGNIDLKSDIDGGGEINKNNDGDLTFSGDNTGFSGVTNINSSGDITFVNGLFGTVNFGDIDGKHVGIIADTVNGEINQTRDATIKYSTVNDINLVFNDKVNVSKGTLEAVARDGKDVNFNDDVNVTGAKIDVTAKNINFSNVVGVTDSNLDVKSEKVTFGDDVNIKESTINSYAKSTLFNNNLSLDNGTLNIAYNGFDVTNNLTVGSTVNVMNGVIANNNIGGDLVVGPSGQSDFKIDIKPRGWTADKTIVNGSITSALQGTVNISDFQFIGKAPIDRYIPLQLFQTSNPISDNIAFAATNKEIFTPIGYYKLFSSGGGGYSANLVRYNPQVFRGQVVTTASYANQLVVNNTLFDHVNVISQRILAENNANKYAASIPQFAPYQYSRKTGGLWVKAYGNFETIGMTQGLNVGNNAYGTLVGADFPVVDLDNGWSFLPTAYIGYNGAHQTFNYTGMTQNGAQAGAMGTFMKDNFIGSLLAYGGGYGNQMEVAGFTENTGNWFAGAAAKAAYNFHPSKNFIIQPTLLASYNYFGSQNWHADFGDMSMSSGLLNGINVAPGLNLIYGRETWSVYATLQYMFNVMGYSKGRAGNVDLEGIKMRHDYFEYGIGFTKTWKDRLDTYLQITMRNGARTGVGFQGGLTFRF